MTAIISFEDWTGEGFLGGVTLYTKFMRFPSIGGLRVKGERQEAQLTVADMVIAQGSAAEMDKKIEWLKSHGVK